MPLSCVPSDGAIDAARRALPLTPLLAAIPVLLASRAAQPSRRDPAWTQITRPEQIRWTPWSGGPPCVGEEATLHGGLDKPGPYVVPMKWYPGYMSAGKQGRRVRPG